MYIVAVLNKFMPLFQVIICILYIILNQGSRLVNETLIVKSDFIWFGCLIYLGL